MAENHKEIERIWILPKMPSPEVLANNFNKGDRANPISHLISYIFSDHRGEMRVVKREFDTGNKYSITVKSRGDMVRDEWEDDHIPQWVYETVEPNAVCGVAKTRYFVDYQNYTLEIDEYQYRFTRGEVETDIDRCTPRTTPPGYYHKDDGIAGKVRLECEFPSEDEANRFELPEWAKDAREVTTNRCYKNSQIAQHGWPCERD
jgi:CYTH domain-containing protein